MATADVSIEIVSRFETEVRASYAGVAPQLVGKETIAVDGTDNQYEDSTEDLSIFADSGKIIVSGNDESVNNGMFTVKTAEANALATVETTLIDEIAGSAVTIKTALPVQYDNDGAFVKPDNALWVRLRILEAVAVLVSIGATKTERYPGEMIAEINYPIGKGTAVTKALADIIRIAFRMIDTSGSPIVRFGTPYKRAMKAKDGFDRLAVHCPYFSDETYT